MKKILFGTKNKTRLEYLQGILHGLPIDLISLSDLDIKSSMAEDGNSPLENSSTEDSIIAAREFAKKIIKAL